MNLYTGLKTTNYTFCMKSWRSLVCDVMFSSNTWLHFKTSKFDFLLFQMPRYKRHPCHVSRAQHLKLFSELTQGFINVLPYSKKRPNFVILLIFKYVYHLIWRLKNCRNDSKTKDFKCLKDFWPALSLGKYEYITWFMITIPEYIQSLLFHMSMKDMITIFLLCMFLCIATLYARVVFNHIIHLFP